MIARRLMVVLSLALAGCADSGVVWNDYAAYPSAVERNRALMMQNPADLVRARESTGRDGARSADVLAKYGRGEATSSAPEALSGGTVSGLGQAGKK